MSALRQLFGPSQKDVWQQLSNELAAQFNGGCWGQGPRIEVNAGQWVVTLDTFTVPAGKVHIPHTRMRAPYVNADGLRFSIARRHLFSELVKWLGGQDIEVGDPVFDRDFIIKGNNPIKVQFLFGNARIRELIAAQPKIMLEVKDDEGWFGTSFPDGVDELCFTVPGVIKEIDQLKSLFELFSEVLNQLCHIGSAYEADPGVKL